MPEIREKSSKLIDFGAVFDQLRLTFTQKRTTYSKSVQKIQQNELCLEAKLGVEFASVPSTVYKPIQNSQVRLLADLNYFRLDQEAGSFVWFEQKLVTLYFNEIFVYLMMLN